MKIYIFDENDEFYRNPTTPLEAPSALHLRIKTESGKAAGAYVSLWQDGGDKVQFVMEFAGAHGSYDVYEHTLQIEKPGLYWYTFQVYTLLGSTEEVSENEGGAFQITAYSPGQKTPDWIFGGMIYHIFVDRFCNGTEYKLKPNAIFRWDWGGTPYFQPDENGIVHNNDFFGGDIQGIINKLPYLEQLGVTCIYLSPVFEAASNHKYDTGDYMNVDPSFGTNETLKQLCKSAEEYGMRVILDGVFNHVGADSRYFNKYGTYDSVGAFQSKDSPYRDWFHFREDGSYESWWGIDLLPSVNESSESYIDFICGENGVIAYWNEMGIAGWRLDVVDELPDVFLDPLCARMKKVNDEAYIVGEVWEDASNKIAYSVRRRYFQGGQLDSVTNYPLKVAIIACVKEGNVEYLRQTMTSLCRNYPPHILHGLMNILGTHDTMRILTVLGGDDFPKDKQGMSTYKLEDWQLSRGKKRLKLASTLQYFLPGVPCVFYGDEAGMEGGADPFCRKCYPWGNEDYDLISWYKILNGVRKANACFAQGKYTLIEARNGLFAFTRGEGTGRVLVAINTTDDDISIKADEFNFDILNNCFTQNLLVRAEEPGLYAIR